MARRSFAAALAAALAAGTVPAAAVVLTVGALPAAAYAGATAARAADRPARDLALPADPTAAAPGSATAPGSRTARPAAAPPAEFGPAWDDPRTAAPPVPKPPTRSCTVRIIDHKFAGWDPYLSSYTPPAGCVGPWSEVVLTLHGAVAGRQYDRLGSLAIGGVTLFKTSTPEPSPTGIHWSVERDVSGYAPLLRSPKPVVMMLGNTVDSTYTGVLDIQVDLTFYTTDRRHPAAATASDVLPLGTPTTSGADLTGTLTVPRNTERLLADVYATGSGGGCEEFWYLTAPTSTGYSCPGDSPYREVQVVLDGKVAGIAAPYPHIYTGGWSNPFLWYVLPAPRAFDVKPIEYDLTPFLGTLTDGRPHQVAVHVVGVPAGLPGWDTPVDFRAWRDPHRAQVTGALVADRLGPLTDTVSTGGIRPDEPGNTVTTHAAHTFDAVGYLLTSHGLVASAVHQALGNDSTHTWGTDENPDGLTATWTDRSWSLDGAKLTGADARYAIDGGISVDPSNRLTTTITVTDQGSGYTDTYTGQASWTFNVPSAQRHAVGTSEERYRTAGRTTTIRTRNGYVY